MNCMMSELSPLELDTVNELTNIGVGRAAAALSALINEEVELNVPWCRLVSRDVALEILSDEMQDEVVAITENFKGDFNGEGLLVFPKQNSLELVRGLLPEQVPLESLTELEQDALVEVGNIILNACIGTYGNLLKQNLTTDLPVLFKGNHNNFMESLNSIIVENHVVIFLNVTFLIRSKNVKGYVVFLMDLNSEENFLQSIKKYVDHLNVKL